MNKTIRGYVNLSAIFIWRIRVLETLRCCKRWHHGSLDSILGVMYIYKAEKYLFRHHLQKWCERLSVISFFERLSRTLWWFRLTKLWKGRLTWQNIWTQALGETFIMLANNLKKCGLYSDDSYVARIRKVQISSRLYITHTRRSIGFCIVYTNMVYICTQWCGLLSK